MGAWFSNVPQEAIVSRVQFGGTEPAWYNPLAVTTHQIYVPSMKLWNLQGSNVALANTTINYQLDNNGIFVLETSAARIYAPRRIVQTIAQLLNWILIGTIDDQDFYILQPFTDLSTMPDLVLTIDSTEYRIPANILADPYDDPSFQGVRMVGVDLLSGLDPVWILGYPFLITYYSIYDFDNDTVSLSLAVRV